MKITLKQYRRVEEEIASKEVTLPTEPVYYFQTGSRRSIKIVPIFTTWLQKNENKPEEIYSFDVTYVYGSFEARIEKVTINKGHLEKMYYGDSYFKRTTDVEFVKDWMDGYLSERTKEQFDTDFENVLNKIKG